MVEEVTGDLRNLHPRSFVICTPHLGDQIEANEMGRACSLYGEGVRCIQSFAGNI